MIVFLYFDQMESLLTVENAFSQIFKGWAQSCVILFLYSKSVKIFSCSIYLICIACDTIFLLAIYRFVAKMFMWDWFTGMLNYLGEFFPQGKLIKKINNAIIDLMPLA